MMPSTETASYRLAVPSGMFCRALFSLRNVQVALSFFYQEKEKYL
jgi:hypothetical protein